MNENVSHVDGKGLMVHTVCKLRTDVRITLSLHTPISRISCLDSIMHVSTKLNDSVDEQSGLRLYSIDMTI